MDRSQLFQDFQQRVQDLLRNSPAADLERNMKAVMAQAFNRLDLVTREEFEVQAAMLEDLRQRIEVLESRLAQPAPAAGAPQSGVTQPGGL